jgi:hypothetical protein
MARRKYYSPCGAEGSRGSAIYVVGARHHEALPVAEWRFHHVGLFATRARDVTQAPPLDAAKRDVTFYEKP